MIEICEIRIFWIRKLDSRDLICEICGVNAIFARDSGKIRAQIHANRPKKVSRCRNL